MKVYRTIKNIHLSKINNLIGFYGGSFGDNESFYGGPFGDNESVSLLLHGVIL